MYLQFCFELIGYLIKLIHTEILSLLLSKSAGAHLLADHLLRGGCSTKIIFCISRGENQKA